MCPTTTTSQLDQKFLEKKLIQAENSIRSTTGKNAGAVLAFRSTLLQDSDLNSDQPTTQANQLQPAVPLSSEERHSLLEKLSAVSQLPTIALQKDEELYLEQQLGELLGFEVTSELESHRIPFVTGIARANSHIKMTPTDTLSQHQVLPESNITDRRSHFGWQFNRDHQSAQAAEKYSVAVPLLIATANVTTASSVSELLQWYRQQKILIINARDQVAAVCTVVDTFIDSSGKYQYGTSPEVSRECLLWSLGNRGRIVAFFVNDRSNSIDPGIYSLV
ncbi:MAG: hypothetical protein WDZ94_04400 [Patescibacteria group bacterium]